MARVHAETHAAPASPRDGVRTNSLYGKDIISMQDLSLSQIQLILDTAEQFKSGGSAPLLRDKIIAQCFFEPSTRTRLSFETAALRLGGNIIGFSSDEATSVRKGETLHDTMRVISAYADLLVIRHGREGAARLAADITDKPVINAGDGANQHPTQALIDLFSIRECQGRIDGLSIALVGDLKYGRTIHSFAQACMRYDIRLFLVAPESLTLQEWLCDLLKQNGVRFSFHQSLEEVIPKVDILYMTRIQQERFTAEDYQMIRKQYLLKRGMLASAKPNLKVLHPLPRVNELDVAIDGTPHAYYFEQAANGVCVRQALLALLLNKE